MKSLAPAIALMALGPLLARPCLAQGTLRPESILPPETMIYVGTDNVAAMLEAGKSSATGKILAEPEVREFLAKPLSMLTGAIEAGISELKSSNPSLKDLDLDPKKLLDGPYGAAFVAVTHVDIPSDIAKGGRPDIGLVIGIQAHQGAIDIIDLVRHLTVSTLQQQGQEVKMETVEVGPASYSRMNLGGENSLPLCFARVGGIHLLSLSSRSIEKMLANAAGAPTSLESQALFQESQKVAGAGGPGSPKVFFRVHALLDLCRQGLAIAAEEDEEGKQIASAVTSIIDALGLGGLKSVYAVSGWDQGVAVTRAMVKLDPAAGGICKMIDQAPAISTDLLKLVPANAGGFSVMQFELAPIYDAIMGALETSLPDVHSTITGTMRGFAGQISGTDDQGNPNWDIERDLIQAIGGELFYLSTPGQPTMLGPGTDIAGWMGTSNPAGLEKSLEYLAALPGKLAEFPVTFKEEEYKGVKLKVLDPSSLGPMAMMAASMQPTYAVHGNRMYFALQTQAMKKLLDSLQNPPADNITTKADFANQYKRLRTDASFTSLSYSDTAKGFETQYSTIMGVVPMVLMSAPISEEDLPVELSLMPTAESISKHLFGTVSASYRMDGGITLSESYGPFGAELGLLLAGGIGVGAGAAAFLGAHRMEAAQQIPPPSAAQDLGQAAREDMSNLKAAITVYIIEFGDPPDTLGQLVEPKPAYPNGVLLQDSLPADPWGNQYRYQRDGDNFTLWSIGANGKDESGAGDDLKETG